MHVPAGVSDAFVGVYVWVLWCVICVLGCIGVYAVGCVCVFLGVRVYVWIVWNSCGLM